MDDEVKVGRKNGSSNGDFALSGCTVVKDLGQIRGPKYIDGWLKKIPFSKYWGRLDIAKKQLESIQI